VVTDRQFTCPACGHPNVYDPDGCDVVVRFKPGQGLKEFRYRLVRCSGCGKEHEVPEGPK
jgi:transcription elongation factor Elf1